MKTEIAYGLADEYLKMQDASLRDYFAAKALPALLASAVKFDWAADDAAAAAYRVADAMLEERKK